MFKYEVQTTDSFGKEVPCMSYDGANPQQILAIMQLLHVGMEVRISCVACSDSSTKK